MRAAASYGLWLAIAAASLFALIRISDDYLKTISTLQKFDWRVEQFQMPAEGVPTTTMVLEIKNASDFDLSVKDLEVYLWLNDLTVGKTYGQFVVRTVQAHQTLNVPLTIVMDTPSLNSAIKGAIGNPVGRISGSYKVHAPFANSDFVYRLMLDVDS